MVWLTFTATGLSVIAKMFAGVFVGINSPVVADLLHLAWRMGPRRPLSEGTDAGHVGLRASSARFADARESEEMVFFLSTMPLVVDFEDVDFAPLLELLSSAASDLFDLGARRVAANRARRLSARTERCYSSIAPPGA